MPKCFEPLEPSHHLSQRLDAMLGAHHPALKEAGVTVALILCRKVDANGEIVDPAISVGGYPALAKIKINSLEDRVQGKADATITIDGNHWDEWPTPRVDAILDHELTHLELRVDKDGSLVRDDCGRPVLRMRRHDQQHGWFNDVAKRHGEDAVEVEQLKQATAFACENGWLPGFSGG